MAWVLTASAYFLLFDGRWETWTWVSSVNTHLMSTALSFFLFAAIICGNRNWWRSIFVFTLALCIGGLNEVNAISVALLSILLLIIRKEAPAWNRSHLNLILCIAGIGVSLLININSGGYKLRMEGLPDFAAGQSLKNTLHTFLLPFLQIKSFIIAFVSLSVFVLFFKNSNWTRLNHTQQALLGGMILIAAVNFFLHCYTLSDIVPARGELWTCCFLLLLFSTYLRQRTTAT